MLIICGIYKLTAFNVAITHVSFLFLYSHTVEPFHPHQRDSETKSLWWRWGHTIAPSSTLSFQKYLRVNFTLNTTIQSGNKVIFRISYYHLITQLRLTECLTYNVSVFLNNKQAESKSFNVFTHLLITSRQRNVILNLYLSL